MRGPERSTEDREEPDSGHLDGAVVRPGTVRECLSDDTGATTAEYAITTLATVIAIMHT